ncbi:unnamed protein product [Schistosoma curassoni]|uniref:Uncharacterized protein n=1 Tax=Schistosoma curassoni TaxID=6186 RepID=A0A183JN56_9TREM|nr:unnamed protein product [Schistosoma curassoni]
MFPVYLFCLGNVSHDVVFNQPNIEEAHMDLLIDVSPPEWPSDKSRAAKRQDQTTFQQWHWKQT